MATFIGTNIPDIINGTAQADLIQGLGGDGHLLAHDGNDTMLAGSGSDILEAGRGDDRLAAEGEGASLLGSDRSDILLSGGTGVDAASYEAAARAVSANLSTGRVTVAGVADTLVQVENLIGSQFRDVLTGDVGANELSGATGNDKLGGAGGKDHLSGGTGNDPLDGGTSLDELRGGAGTDTVGCVSQSGAVDVDLNSGQTFSQDRFDVLSEVEAARASNFGDQLVGCTAANTLVGKDALTGGTGANTFAFVALDAKFGRSTDPGFDRVSDFDRGAGGRIDLTDHRQATDLAALGATASQFGTDTHLRLGGDTIVLEDVALSQLSSSVFLF